MTDKNLKQLSENEKQSALDYLQQEPDFNIFIISDIENYGMKTKFQTVWGYYEDNNIIGILLHFYDTFIIYTNNKQAAEAFSSVILETNSITSIAGKQECIELLKNINYFKQKSTRSMYLLKLTSINSIDINKSLHTQRMTIQDISALIEFHKTVPDFDTNIKSGTYKKMLIQNEKEKTGRGYIIKENEQVICSAISSAESSQAAILIGVATEKIYQNKGFATTTVYTLCKELVNEGKTVCLFFDNPDAGSIYKKIGFKDAGFWSICNI